MKIRHKISLSFLVTALLLTGVAVSIMYRSFKGDLKEAIFDHLRTTAQSRAHHIETFLETHKQIVKVIPNLTPIKDNLRPGGDREYLNGMLKQIKEDPYHKDFYELFITDSKGVIIASADESNIGKDKSSYLDVVKGRQEPYVKDAHLSRSTGKKAIDIIAPIRDDRTGHLLGILLVGIEMTGLNEIITDRTGLGETGEIYLINRDSYMISPSRFVQDTFLKLKVDTQNARDCLRPEDAPHHVRGPDTGVFPDYRGVSVLGSHAEIKEMGWGLLAEIDEQEALAPLAKLRLQFGGLMVVIGLAAWLLGLLVSRAVSGPIQRLHKGTEIVGQGNLDYKVGTDARDEIGQLSRAFDSMTGNLKKTTASRDELAQEVTERNRAEEELKARSEELERFNKTMVGRELRMVELKKEIKELKARLAVGSKTK